MLSAETHNKIPKNYDILKTCFRSSISAKEIENCINEIQTNFPKVIEVNGFYRFKEWDTRHNRIEKKELPRNSPGTPQGALDKIRVREEGDKNKTSPKSYFYLTYEKAFKKPYAVHAGKDWQIFDDLKKTHSDIEVMTLIDKFFKYEDEFIKKAGRTVQVFASVINKLQLPDSPKWRLPC